MPRIVASLRLGTGAKGWTARGVRYFVALASLLHDVFNFLHGGRDGGALDGAGALGLVDLQDAAGEVLDLANLGPALADDAPRLPLALHHHGLDGVLGVLVTAAPAAGIFLGLLRRLALSLGGGLVRVEVLRGLLLLFLLLRGLGLLIGARIVVEESLLPHGDPVLYPRRGE